MIYSPRWQHLYQIERKRIAATPPNYLRLHRLERPEPWADWVWPNADHINQYPYYPSLISRLARFIGQPPERIVLGAGIEDLIRTLVLLSCDKGDGFAFTWPTCAMFEIYAQVFQAKAIKLVTNPAAPLTAASVASVAKDCKLLLLPNPGQPVETCFGLNDLRVIASECRHYNTVFAIDEAYFGFGGPTGLPLVDEFDNVVVLRTFSKAFGAAGIRVGFAVGQEKAVKPLEAIRLSGEITGPSLRAASRLIALWGEVVEPGIRQIQEGRDWLRESFISQGFQAWGQYANHVLVDVKSQAEMQRLVEGLEARAVRVKGGYPSPLNKHLLVTAGPVPMMERFMAAFQDCLREEAA